MGLRIEREVGEAITISLPDGSHQVLTRNQYSLTLVNWSREGRSSRTLRCQLNALYVLGPDVKMRLRHSRRGEQYLSFLIIAPKSVVISRTEEPRATQADPETSTLTTRSPANG